MSAVFVVNSGSSSIKYQLINPLLKGDEAVIASGIIDQIGQPEGKYTITHNGEKTQRVAPIPDHVTGMQLLEELFHEVGLDLDQQGVVAVGHRVVQGGDIFAEPTIIDDTVLQQISDLSALAPLHNPAHVVGIESARKLMPDVPHVAVFDTAFFAHLPAASRIYPIPQDIAKKYGIRRYGAHGTSHQYVSRLVPTVLDRDPQTLRQIVLHLGNGASVSAIKGGVPIDTSMGLTPLQGLVMGTRCGDIDPSVVFHLVRVAGMTIDEIDTMMNRESGMKALIGTNDMRVIRDMLDENPDDQQANDAFDIYTARIRHYVGGYMLQMGGVDVITFTGGIGENDRRVRKYVTDGLEELGIIVDHETNWATRRGPKVISTPESRVTVLVAPTNEELAIAQQALELVTKA